MRAAVEYPEFRRIDVAHRTDQQDFILERGLYDRTELPRVEFLEPAHHGLDVAIGVVHHRIAVIVASTNESAVSREDGMRDIDQGMREQEFRLIFVLQVDEPKRSMALRRPNRIRLTGILGADCQGREVLLAAEYLEFAH